MIKFNQTVNFYVTTFKSFVGRSITYKMIVKKVVSECESGGHKVIARWRYCDQYQRFYIVSKDKTNGHNNKGVTTNFRVGQ